MLSLKQKRSLLVCRLKLDTKENHEGNWGTTYFTVSTYITVCKENHEQKQRSLDEGEQRQGGAQNF